MDLLTENPELTVGSISSLFDTQQLIPDRVERDLKATTDRVEHDPEAAFSGYAEVQLAVALKWDPQQRKMILLEQLYNCDIGQQCSTILLHATGLLILLEGVKYFRSDKIRQLKVILLRQLFNTISVDTKSFCESICASGKEILGQTLRRFVNHASNFCTCNCFITGCTVIRVTSHFNGRCQNSTPRVPLTP